MSTRPASPQDNNPRPAKRQRRSYSSSESDDEELPLPSETPLFPLAPLPVSTLLVSLPGILIHPPTHRHHARSLCVSLLALRKCLSIPDLTPDIECRAWTALAEVGMIAISGGFSQNEDHIWAQSLENEVEKASSKALLISQKHPSLRLYRPYVTSLIAQLAHWQQNHKFARNMLRRLVKTFLSDDPPHTIYSAHLTLISVLSTPTDPTKGLTAKDTQAALSAIQAFVSHAENAQHHGVKLFGLLIRLRLLISSGLWDRVGDALTLAEEALGFDFTDSGKGTDKSILVPISNAPQQTSENSTSSPSKTLPTLPHFPDKLSEVMAIHILIVGVVFYTYVGNAASTAPRLTQLHMLMDSGSWKDTESGVVEIIFHSSPPLHIQTTHPRILLILAYLVSAIAKKDPVGRKPKRKLFANEGLTMWEKEMRKPIVLSPWASVSDVTQLEYTMNRLKGDLLCELVGVHIMRSEFVGAQKHIDVLVAHVRTVGLWDAFSARVLLHEAHLAHARGDSNRAESCYAIAADLASEGQGRDDYVETCARAGMVGLKIGLGKGDYEESMQVVESCKGLGGTLRSVGKIIEACMSSEILKAKTCLKSALTITGESTDNHLRCLVLALISSHFMHTATDYAMKMLGTCEQIASGLGAGAVKGAKNTHGADTVGNIPLRIWTAERFLELHRRQGDAARAQKQTLTIEALKTAQASAVMH
ncbi:hypothetical protein BDZ89DRAFT_347994 [Hymenopellis radicata]|nr:hypothetical protein BDZ89DRAFT_347994 [Hymenopellis radicata]